MYTALVLTPESVKQLRENCKVPAGWDVKCHHMTINMGLAAHGPAADQVGQEFPITVIANAKDKRVMAVAVETACPSVNTTKHITVAVNVQGGGKPKHSNELNSWNALPTRFDLKGVVQEVQ